MRVGTHRMANDNPNSNGLGLQVLRNRYFVMRHGESEANVLGVAVGDPKRGVQGFGLTDLGRRQAAAAASAFAQTYRVLLDHTEVFTSDFRRTRETAELLAKGLGESRPIRVREGLRERFFGELEGKDHRTLAALLETEGIAALISRYGCEPAELMQDRVVGVVRELEKDNQHKTLMLVSHADPIQALMAAFAGIDMSESERIAPIDYAEIAELSLDMPLRLKDDGTG